GRVGQLGKYARDFEVDELAARLRRLPVSGLANEIVGKVVMKSAPGRRNAAQNAAALQIFDAGDELGRGKRDQLTQKIGREAPTERRCPSEELRRGGPQPVEPIADQLFDAA